MFTRFNSLLRQKPKALHEFDDDRKVTWLELFYDLVYVALVSNMVHHLGAHFTLEALGIFILLFIPVFLSWMNGTYYHDFHGREDIRGRIITLVQMITVGAMAVTINKAFEGQLLGFTVAYMIHHAITTLIWYRVGYHNKNQRDIVKYYVVGYLLSILTLFISLFFSGQITILLWILAVVFSFGTPLFARQEHEKLFQINPYLASTSPSVMERFGLFTILILGESIAGVVNGLSTFQVMKPYYFWGVLIFGITISFAIWWFYFDLVRDKKVKKGSGYWISWNYLHLPLFVAIGLIGASIQYIVGHGGDHIGILVAWSLGASVSAVILSLCAISYILVINKTFCQARQRVNTVLFIIAFILLLIPLSADYVDPVVYLGLIFIALVISLFFRIKVFVALELPEGRRNGGNRNRKE